MLWICEDCTAKYSVGAKNCPQCGSTEHRDEGVEPSPIEPVDEGGAEVGNLSEGGEGVQGKPPAAAPRRRAK